MSKIVQAVNTMISNSDKITDVYVNGNEFFFVYNGKHKWSIISKDDGKDYVLFYYPEKTIKQSIEQLAKMSFAEFNSGSFVSYDTEELKTQEARESFSELYLVIKEKQLNVDKILQEIIDDFPF